MIKQHKDQETDRAPHARVRAMNSTTVDYEALSLVFSSSPLSSGCVLLLSVQSGPTLQLSNAEMSC